jgi:NADPH:quinone reductase
MRSIVIPAFGGPEVLAVAEREAPVPGPGQVAIAVARSGLNYAEVLFRRGVVDIPLPFVPGIEVAGRVAAVGAGVTGLSVGQPVAALTIVDGGGYAEVALADARLVAPLPDGVGEAELLLAAAAPSNTTTAFLALGDVARIRPGETVLVQAAAGGLGSQVGQVARLLGAGSVVGVVGSPEKVAAARAFGYDEVVVRADLEQAAARLTDGRGFDVVVDPVGGPSRRASYAALALGGRMLVVGNASAAEDVAFGAGELWFSGKALMGFNLREAAEQRPEEVGAALRRAVAAVLDGSVRVAVEPVAFDAVADAHRRIEAGATTGKLVLAMA